MPTFEVTLRETILVKSVYSVVADSPETAIEEARKRFNYNNIQAYDKKLDSLEVLACSLKIDTDSIHRGLIARLGKDAKDSEVRYNAFIYKGRTWLIDASWNDLTKMLSLCVYTEYIPPEEKNRHKWMRKIKQYRLTENGTVEQLDFTHWNPNMPKNLEVPIHTYEDLSFFLDCVAELMPSAASCLRALKDNKAGGRPVCKSCPEQLNCLTKFGKSR